MIDIVRAVVTAYHAATHTADVRPILGPAAVLEGIPVLESCRPDLLAADDNVALLLWSDVGGLVLGPWGAVPGVTVPCSVFIPALGTTGTGAHSENGWAMLEAEQEYVWGHGVVPANFVSTLTCKLVVKEAAAGTPGNVRAYNTAYYSAAGEPFDHHSDTSGWTTFALGVDSHNHGVLTISLTDAAVDDIIQFRGLRSGISGLDTYGADPYYKGWLLEYLGVR